MRVCKTVIVFHPEEKYFLKILIYYDYVPIYESNILKFKFCNFQTLLIRLMYKYIILCYLHFKDELSVL